jgi:predicted dehydrogenase
MSHAGDVRVAVIGLGYWGPNLVRNIHELPGMDLSAVCDLRPDALDRVARRYPAVRTTSDYESVLTDARIDAVAIATPVSTHAGLAVRALESGKHVFVEKPLAASLAEAIALREMAQRMRLVLMVGHTFLYSPSVNKVRELIQSGELGEIYFISSSRVNLGLHQSDVSVAWDLGPHDFSILSHWLGESPACLSALSRGCVMPDAPDVAFINMEYASGPIAHVELSWLAPSKLRRTTVVGSRKMVVYDDASMEPVRVFDSGVVVPDPETFGEYRFTYRTGDIVSPHVVADEPLTLEMEDFRQAIAEDTMPRASADMGVQVVGMIEAVERSLRQRGARVEVDQVATLVP